MPQFKVPTHDAARPGQHLITIQRCFDGRDLNGCYIQVAPFSNNDLPLAYQVAALPELLAVCEEATREPSPDSDPASLLATLRERARDALRVAELDAMLAKGDE